MRQVIRKGLKDIVVDAVPDPIVTPHHVIVQPHYSLISSGTETASIHSESLLKEVADNPSHIGKILGVMKSVGPLATIAEVRAKFSEYAVLGYSGAGFVVDKHPTVTSLELGERVAYGGEGTGHGERILTGEKLVARVPDGLGLDRACFATLGSIAMNAVRISQIGIGDRVAVIGQGLVGQLVTQLAKLQGAVVIALDLNAERSELAARLGADHALVADSEATSKIASLTEGRGVDCAFIAAAAKSAAPCHQALAITRDRGRIVVVGAVEMEFPWNDMYLKEIQLFMSRAYGPGSYDPLYERRGVDYPFAYVRWTENRNMEEFLRLLSAGLVNVDPLVSHRFSLEDAPQAYRTIMDRAVSSMAVVLRYPQADEPFRVEATPPVRKVTVSAAAPTAGVLQVALVGAGNLAKWAHLPNIRNAPGVALRAIHSSNGARGKSYALRFGASYCATDYQEILSDPAVDAVVIVSRNQHHASQAIAALTAGKHVFVEKPLALTEDECRAIVRAQRESGRIVTTGFNRRFAPFYVRLKKAIGRRSGPVVINCRVNSPGISGGYWMADPAIGGAILGEACHFVDLMAWLVDSEIASVSAYSLPTDVEAPVGQNNIVASFRLADDSIGNLTYCTVGSKTSGGERVEVFASGVGVMTQDFKKLSVSGDRIARSSSRFWPQKGYAEQLADFVDAIRVGREPAVTLRDGVRATVGCLRLLDAARKREGCDIDLDAVLA
ncbi:MAG: Inositol 2-dehydrogenase/D-chiro-inositol 3-dehydrogenase [Gemmatimonadaceae bacterium]|nr:Inositol 2-dehydrogenase/D-chiro-inositol 3-dehydrogenase [Gemmatimonadaceae bacterium]